MRRAALLVAALVLAGCGGDGGDRLSKEAYQAKVREVGSTLAATLGGISTSGTDLSNVGAQVSQLQTSLRDAASELDELSPPEDVEGAHGKLVSGIRAFADDLEDLSAAIGEQDLDAIRRFENDFTNSDAVRQIREAAEELQQQGYSLE